MPAAAVLPILSKMIASPHFWKVLVPTLFAGQTVLSEVGKAGERGVAKKQIDLQRLLGESQITASKRATEESRERAKEYTKLLLEDRKESRKEAKEQELMQMFMEGQNQRMALLMSAIQGISQTKPQYSPMASQGGMVGLMRSRM